MARSGPALVLRWLPLAAAWLVCVLAGVDVIGSEDLGYHLAYGRHFLASGQVVDHDPRLYTLAEAERSGARHEPGPGSWYDAAGRYRFPNANWLSQVIIALAHAAAGVAGFNVLLVLLVGALAALLVVLMRRLDVPPPAMAAALLLTVCVAYQRFTLRPELLGYVVLAAQACVLAAAWCHGRRKSPLGWAAVGVLVGLQVLFVNLHSYFPLGVALSGAILVGAVAERDLAARHVHLARLGAACAGQALACLVNPWGWRLAALPFQTAAYLREHGLSRGPETHPWSAMGELRRTALFQDGGATGLMALGAVACLMVIVGGAAAALTRRRFDWLLVMAGMTFVAFSAQRNMAVGLLIALPFALAGLRQAPWWGSLFEARWCLPVIRATVVVAAGALGWSLVTSALYIAQDSPLRFGTGLSRLSLPVGAAEWLTEHGPVARVWATPVCSSTIYGFVQPPPQLNFVTNTWAYPPQVMTEVFAAGGMYGAPPPFDRRDVEIVVTRPGPLLRELVRDGAWVPVHVEGPHAVLAPAVGPWGRFALDPDALDVQALIAQTRQLDAVPALALALTAPLLLDLGWMDAAIEMLAAARREDPTQARAWVETANAFTRRFAARGPRELDEARADLRQVIFALDRAWQLSGDPQLHADLRALSEKADWLQRVADNGVAGAMTGRVNDR